MFARTSEHFTACVVIYPDGKIRKASIQHVNLHSKDRALAELAAGHVAWSWMIE